VTDNDLIPQWATLFFLGGERLFTHKAMHTFDPSAGLVYNNKATQCQVRMPRRGIDAVLRRREGGSFSCHAAVVGRSEMQSR
jgi:hypothetical protein